MCPGAFAKWVRLRNFIKGKFQKGHGGFFGSWGRFIQR
jgi:hypothetical protein